MEKRPTFESTTVLAVRREGKAVMASDGQVTLGQTVVKQTARKIRRLYNDRVLAGFAGSAADSFALFSRFDAKLEQYRGNLERSVVELAKDWRTDRILRRLDAMLIVADSDATETYNLLNISKLNKCKSLVRVSNLDKIEIQKVLELNPDGILVPQISSYNDVLKLIDYSFYPPIGNRGLSPYTPGFNYSHQDSEIKKKKINNNLFLGILLEGENGINDLDVILKDFSKHISLIYFGLYDYASSQGLNPEWNNKKIIKSIKQIILKCKKKGINVGSIARNSKEIKILKKIGINFICYQNDTGIINQAFSKID